MTRDELSKKVDDFVNKYKGQTKGYPTDTSYNGECLSIVKLYMKEVFGFDAPPSGSNSAYGYWANFPNPLGTYFTKVQNTPSGVPKKGDIPIWNTSAGGGFGHIAIFVSGDVNAFTSFDQNWGGRQSHLQAHDYTNIVGWLEPKLSVPSAPTPIIEITNQTKIPQIGNKEVQQIASELKAKDSRIYDLENQVDKLNASVTSLNARIRELEQQLANLPPTSTEAQETLKKLHDVLWGSGFWFIKYWEIQKLLPR